MLERAVRRNALVPEIECLDIFLSSAFDSTGGVITRDFDKWVAEQQKTEAVIFKQHRMWREESADAARKNGPAEAGGGKK